MCSQRYGNWRSGDGCGKSLWASERSHLHGDRKGPISHLHGDRKGPPDPTLPPSPLLYDVGAAKPVYSSGESGAMGMGGPLRSPCRITNRSPPLHAKIMTRETPRIRQSESQPF